MQNNSHFLVRGAAGIAAGIVIAAVDNFAFEGEVSPIVIVLLLIAATGIFGAVWGWRGWMAAGSTWFIIPFVHAVKYLFGLPDTIQPNTAGSIMMLAGFTFVIAGIGLAIGAALHKADGGEKQQKS